MYFSVLFINSCNFLQFKFLKYLRTFWNTFCSPKIGLDIQNVRPPSLSTKVDIFPFFNHTLKFCPPTCLSDQTNRLVKFHLPSFPHFGLRAFQSFRRHPFSLPHPLLTCMSTDDKPFHLVITDKDLFSQQLLINYFVIISIKIFFSGPLTMICQVRL